MLDVLEDGRHLSIGGGTPRRILGVLLSQANQVVSADSLIEAVWGDNPPPSAAKTLQSHLVRLRAVVDPDRQRIRTRAPGYMLIVEATDLDALRFEQLTATPPSLGVERAKASSADAPLPASPGGVAARRLPRAAESRVSVELLRRTSVAP